MVLGKWIIPPRPTSSQLTCVEPEPLGVLFHLFSDILHKLLRILRLDNPIRKRANNDMEEDRYNEPHGLSEHELSVRGDNDEGCETSKWGDREVYTERVKDEILVLALVPA